MRLLELLATRPSFVEPEAFRSFLAIVSRQPSSGLDSIRASGQVPGEDTMARSLVTIEDGVAILSIHGPIARHADMFSDVCGGTTTQRLAKDIKESAANPDIKAILLDIDSPGGEATGIQELAAAIRAVTAIKPVVAYVGGSGCSAAYYLASAASEIVADPTALLGSIGVVIAYEDSSALKESMGVKDIEIISSQSPNKRLNPATDEGRSSYQRIVDDLAAVFVADVATYRGTTQKAVLSDFGQGGVMVGKRAVKAGLADRLGSRDGLIKELSAGTWRRPSRSASTPTARADAGQTSPQSKGESAMSWSERFNFWKAAGKPENFDMDEDLDAEASESTVVAPLKAKLVVGEAAANLQPIAGLEEMRKELAAREASESELKSRYEQLVADAADRDAKAKADAEAARVDAAEASAASFAEKVVAANKAFPAEQASLASLYRDAAEDDHERPRASGKSRVQVLADACEARPAHRLTDASMSGKGLPKGAVVLPSGGAEDSEFEQAIEANRKFIARQNALATKAKAK